MMYVKLILKYSSTVWAPYTNYNIDKLEAIQRCAARYVHVTAATPVVLHHA